MVHETRRSGYPAQYHTMVRSVVRISAWFSAVTLLVAAVATVLAVYWGAPPVLAAVALTVFIFFGIFGSVGSIVDVRSAAVIPYFQRRIGEIHTFASGHALARNLVYLDELAEQEGTLTLTSFGFADDLRGEMLVWHPAEAGLATVDRLLARLNDSAVAINDVDKVVNDLEKVRHALQRAQSQGTPFCLLFRHGNGTCQQEWDLRKGTAF